MSDTGAPALLICNPSAGGGRGARLGAAYLALLREAGWPARLEHTRDLDHAGELAAEAAGSGQLAAAVGGDGLVGRVAGATARAGGLMAVLPGGRGNDFARYLGIPADPAAAVTALRGAVERRLDLGSVDGVPYACIASVGFDSDVQERVAVTRLPLGALVYPAMALWSALRWRHATFVLTRDGRTDRMRGWSVVAANTSSYGGGMLVAPGANAADGLLEVVTTAASGRWRFLRSFPLVFSGRHVELDIVGVSRAARLQVSADRPFRVFADGDPIGRLPCTFSVLPGALRVLAPPATGPAR